MAPGVDRAGRDGSVVARPSRAPRRLAPALAALALALSSVAPPLLAPAPAIAQQAAAPDREAIAELQAALNELGYDAGPADGLAGPRTAAAIEAWQRDRGLSVTGAADAATLAALRAERAAAPDAQAPVVAGTRAGAVAAPAPPAGQPLPSVSSPARRPAGDAGSIAARRGLGASPGGATTPTGLTPHGRRAEAPAPPRGTPAAGLEQETVRADTSLPRVRHHSQERPTGAQRPGGVGTLPGEGRIGDRPTPPPGYAEREDPGSFPTRAGGAGGGSPGLVSLPLLPAITPPDWLTKTRLAAGLATLALLSLLCHRIARRPRRRRQRDTVVTTARAAPLR